jgi:prolyl-tRNA synthetase
MMSGKIAHEFMYLNPIGEDTILICEECGYAANRQIATFQKPISSEEELLQLEKVATPGTHTIVDLAAFLSISEAKTAKAVLMMATISEKKETIERFVFAVLRGDMEMNETKLANAVKAKTLRPATEEEILEIGAVPGFASPIGVHDAIIVVDDAVTTSPNLVAGANEEGYHLLNVNYGRDYKADIVADITAAQEGNACPECGAPLTKRRGIEVGNIFQLGTFYSEALGCTYLDANGKAQPVVMGSYGIGIGRLLACAAEAHHDDYGLMLPITIAPYQVHLIALSGKGGSETLEAADNLYTELLQAGLEVLYDDRNESPGVKFNDADLIGIPIRLTVSKRAMKAGGVEFKRRDLKEKEVVPSNEVISRVREEIAILEAAIAEQVVPVAYPEK